MNVHSVISHKFWVAAACGLLLAGGGAGVAVADIIDVEASDKIETEAAVTVGYRGTSVHGAPGRALEYDSLESGPLLGARLFTDRGPYHLDFKINYLNDKDYSARASVDTTGLVRLDLRTERFFHNLDHIPYDNGNIGETAPLVRTPAGPPAEGSRPDALFNGTYRAIYTDRNPTAEYGLRLDVSEAKLKVKCPDYPAHFTLSYWRYEKAGEKQLRFADENCATACHMQSKSRKIDRVTDEVKAGIDAHAGFVDLALEALYRAFRDHQSVPADDFGNHSRGRAAGNYDHDEDPDSQLTELTLRVNTAPSGGLVGSASFTIGERENRSDLTSVSSVEAETDYYKTAADVTYTPSQNWTFNLRYRLLNMESSNSDGLTDTDAFTSPLAVRDAIDIDRAWYEAVANYRPTSRLTFKGELRREEIDRSNTGAAVAHSSSTVPITINPNWALPDEENITRVKLGFNSRMLQKSALKVSGWASLQRNDDPAYGTSFAESRELFLAVNYVPESLWGLAASVNLLSEENDGHEIRQSATAVYDLERERRQQNASLGAWLNPLKGLTFDLNYGYLRTAINQDLLFGSGTNNTTVPPTNYAIEDEGVDYRQAVHSLSAGATWQPTKQIACRLEGYHIRSKAYFSPEFEQFGVVYSGGLGDATAADLRGISKLDVRQNGVRGRVDWKLDENWACGIEATFDEYDENGGDVFDGSVQTAMVSLSRSW